jgi:hypothetical protein
VSSFRASVCYESGVGNRYPEESAVE